MWMDILTPKRNRKSIEFKVIRLLILKNWFSRIV